MLDLQLDRELRLKEERENKTRGRGGKRGRNGNGCSVWNQVRNSVDVHACLVSTHKLTIRCHPQGLQSDGEALHVWELLWTEGVWLPVRGAWLGFLTLSRDPTSLPMTAVKVLPGFQERVVSSTPGTYDITDSHGDEEPHRGISSTPSWRLTSLSRVSARLTQPVETETRSILS